MPKNVNINNITVRVGPDRLRRSGGGCSAGFLEFLFGLFGVFGIGHLATGRILFGLFVMVSFWLIGVLCVVSIVGWVVLPSVWAAYLLISPIIAMSR